MQARQAAVKGASRTLADGPSTPSMSRSTPGVPLDAPRNRLIAPERLLRDSFGEGMTIHRPTCDTGVSPPRPAPASSTGLKGGSDDAHTAQDVHGVLAGLLVRELEACRMMGGDSGPILC